MPGAGLGGPVVLWVEMQVRPEFRADFLDALLEDARGSRENEPGCLRFDVLVDSLDSNRFFLYEVYRDAAAVEAHEAAPHFRRIAAGLGEWLASPATVPTARYVDPPGG